VPEDKELPRQTFEIVLENQGKLREWISRLIHENREVKLEERDRFLDTYFRATLGLGSHVCLGGKFRRISKWTLDHIVYQLSDGKPGIECGPERSETKLVPASKIWKLVEERLSAVVFGEALQQAVALSPEKEGGETFGGLRGRKKG